MKKEFNSQEYNSFKTAIDRKRVYKNNPSPMSAATKWLLQNGMLSGKIMDFGNGYGADTEILNDLGFKCKGYDRYSGIKSYSNRRVLTGSYDMVICHYVFNVIYSLKEHEETLKLLKDLDAERVIISIRTKRQFKLNWKYIKEEDCFITSSNTAQRHYKVSELEKYFGNHRVLLHTRDLYIIELYSDNAGDKLFRAKRGKELGKYIGGIGYIHRDYAEDVMPDDMLKLSRKYDIPDNYNILKWDPKKKKLECIESPDFDTALAPKVGKRIKIEDGKAPKEEPEKGLLFHKKFYFVGDDYDGFDVSKDKLLNCLIENSGIATINDKKRIGREEYWKKSMDKLEFEAVKDLYYK